MLSLVLSECWRGVQHSVRRNATLAHESEELNRLLQVALDHFDEAGKVQAPQQRDSLLALAQRFVFIVGGPDGTASPDLAPDEVTLEKRAVQKQNFMAFPRRSLRAALMSSM